MRRKRSLEEEILKALRHGRRDRELRRRDRMAVEMEERFAWRWIWRRDRKGERGREGSREEADGAGGNNEGLGFFMGFIRERCWSGCSKTGLGNRTRPVPAKTNQCGSDRGTSIRDLVFSPALITTSLELLLDV